ncbi:MAG: hypothetical protein FWC26_01030 [Fibromonadales bacterium]|nr:hypothetical protein [Fibromonadales bacterium]
MGKYILNDWKSIKNFINKKLRLNSEKKSIIYRNLNTGERIILSSESAGKIAGHYKDGEIYQKTIIHIPEIIKNMKLLEDMQANKKGSKFSNYSYYITNISLAGKPYTVLSTIGREGNNIYYDHNTFDGTSQNVFNFAKNTTTDPKYSRLSEILKNVDLKLILSHINNKSG